MVNGEDGQKPKHQQKHYSSMNAPQIQQCDLLNCKANTKKVKYSTKGLSRKRKDIDTEFQKYSKGHVLQKCWRKKEGTIIRGRKGAKPQLIQSPQVIWTPYLVRLGVVAGMLEGEQVQSWDIVLGATGVEGG